MSQIRMVGGHHLVRNNLPTASKEPREERFVDSLQKHLERNSWLNRCRSEECYYLREFGLYGYGIADMVLVPGLHRKKKPIDKSFLVRLANSPSLSKLLLYLSNTKTVNRKRLAYRIGVSNHTLTELMRLISLHTARKGEVNVVPSLRHIVPDFQLWVLEAKMVDWRGALKQAYRYSTFANRTIVALPQNTAINARSNLSTFKRLRVGLWSYDSLSESLRFLYTPPDHPRKKSEANLRARALVYTQILQLG